MEVRQIASLLRERRWTNFPKSVSCGVRPQSVRHGNGTSSIHPAMIFFKGRDLALQANPITGKSRPLELKAKTREGQEPCVEIKVRNVDGYHNDSGELWSLAVRLQRMSRYGLGRAKTKPLIMVAEAEAEVFTTIFRRIRPWAHLRLGVPALQFPAKFSLRCLEGPHTCQPWHA